MQKKISVICVFLASLIAFLLFPTKILAEDLTYNWGKVVGGTGTDQPQFISKDPDGNFYILGNYSTTVDFNPSDATDSHTSAGGTDTFLTKYDSNWNYLWTKTWGSSSLYEAPYSMDWDLENNMYIYGEFGTTVDFNTDPLSTDYATSSGSTDLYLTKYNSDGTYGWTKTWGSSSAEHSGDVEFDNLGNMYIVGEFQKTIDFNTDPLATDSATSNGSIDIFLTKYDSNGDYSWTKTFGGTGMDYAVRIAFDSNNNVYVTGGFTKTVDFDPSEEDTDSYTANSTLYSNVYDCFLTKFNDDGTYGWTKTWGGAGEDYMNGVSVDSSNNIYITGLLGAWTNSSNLIYDLDPGTGTDNHTLNDPGGDYFSDAVFMKFDSDGNYIWGKTWGGSQDDGIYSSPYFDSNGYVYLASYFQNTVDLDPNSGTDSFTSAGDYDIALSKFDSDGNYYWSNTWGSTGSEGISDFKIYSDRILLGISAGGTFDMDPSDNTSLSTFSGESDIAIVNLSINNSNSTNSDTNTSSSSGSESIQIPEMGVNLGNNLVVFPNKESNTGGRDVFAIVFPGIFNFNAFLSSNWVDPKNLITLILKNVATNKGNTIFAGGENRTILGIKNGNSVYWQIEGIQDIWYKGYPAEGHSSAKIIPELQDKNSIIVLKYDDLSLVPPGYSKTKFSEKKLKLAHSFDGKNWTIINSSVVDPVTNTVAAVVKVGGYYMIVGQY